MRELFQDPFDPVTEGFIEYALQIKRMSPGTIRDMKCTFRQVIKKMSRVRPGVELWRLSFDDFVSWLNERRSERSSPVTIGKEISHLRSLIDYAWRSGRVDRNVLDGFKIKDLLPITQSAPRVLTLEEAKNLVASCPAKTVQQKRERMMILLLYGCGLRSGELCRLDVKDIDIERQELFIREAKGGIQRRIPVPDQVWTELLAYLAQKKPKRGALFLTEVKKTRIRQNDVLVAVHLASRRSGLSEEIMPKTLRHSYATHLMDAGVDLSLIASLMGHRSPNESGVYLHALPGKKELAVQRVEISESLSSGTLEKDEEEDK